MTPATRDPARRAPATGKPHAAGAPASVAAPPPSAGARGPAIPLALAAGLVAFALAPPVRDNPRLVWTFAGVGAALTVWGWVLWAAVRRRGGAFRIAFNPVRSHYVQASVQFGILAYWGWFAREVYAEAPLVAAQVMFLYAFDALLTWTRGACAGQERVWRIGFGPLPIIFSTNLLLWFKHDWYVMQFLMVATGALAKHFLTWRRDGDGRRTHIFNPSAFGQFLFAVALIATGTTSDLTWGERIAATFDPRYLMVVIFLAGLVVQSLFHVTLMTLAAAAVLVVLNLAYTEATGLYYFVTTNFAAPIFLGIHLLVTDPATSPRTNLGRVVFGALYGAAYFALFRILDDFGVPTFWDKLLPVPILNLCVPLIDRLARAGIVGRVNQLWESALAPARLNVVHMACWIGLFGTMMATGYIEALHPGNSIPFWKRAAAEGKPRAARSLLIAAGAQADEGSADAWNELGVIWIEGALPGIDRNPARAAWYFSTACGMGSIQGCANVADQFLFFGETRSLEDVARALDRLEGACGTHPDSNMCFRIGYAYETGHGRPRDLLRAIEFYERCGPVNLFAAKGLARIALSADGPAYDLTRVAAALIRSADSDDESSWYLAYMHLAGNGVPRDPGRARALVEQACRLGSARACEAMRLPELPPFTRPVLLVPPWSTAFPAPPAR